MGAAATAAVLVAVHRTTTMGFFSSAISFFRHASLEDEMHTQESRHLQGFVKIVTLLK
jgi:hypothetical protein